MSGCAAWLRAGARREGLGVSGPRERAAGLLRWYPRAWRARYGEEFTELLLAGLAERPRSAARTADVIRGGLVGAC
jgi:hypothetical protein